MLMKNNKIFKLILFWTLLLSATKPVYTAEKFFLSADSIIKNEENTIITVPKKNVVEITSSKIKIVMPIKQMTVIHVLLEQVILIVVIVVIVIAVIVVIVIVIAVIVIVATVIIHLVIVV